MVPDTSYILPRSKIGNKLEYILLHFYTFRLYILKCLKNSTNLQSSVSETINQDLSESLIRVTVHANYGAYQSP